MKKYTGMAEEGEWKFKGWSDNGHKAFEMWTMSIKTDVEMGRYKLWETAFREAQTKKEDAGGEGASDASKNKFMVNRSVVWEF